MLFCFVFTGSQCVVLFCTKLPVVSVLFCFVLTSSQCVGKYKTKQHINY